MTMTITMTLTITNKDEETEMSELHWKPTKVSENSVGDNLLKAIMSKRHKLPYQLDMHDIEYLKGVRDSGVNGAEELINAIGMHGQIELYLES